MGDLPWNVRHSHDTHISVGESNSQSGLVAHRIRYPIDWTLTDEPYECHDTHPSTAPLIFVNVTDVQHQRLCWR